MPTEVRQLSLGGKVPLALALENSGSSYNGWSFDNEISEGIAREMWQHFLPTVSVQHPRVIVTLFEKRVAEIQFLVHTDKPLETGKSVEREFAALYGKPRISRLRDVEHSCPSELVRKWTDSSTTLIVVSSKEYGAFYVVLRDNKLAKDISSWKQRYYSDVLEKEPCVRW